MRLVCSDPVVPNRIEGNHVAMVFDLFRVARRQPRIPAHLHPHGEWSQAADAVTRIYRSMEKAARRELGTTE